MLTIESASNPVYANAENTCIDLNVKFAEFDEVLPFSATPYDPHDYGVELFNRAISGEFGPIAPYVARVLENQPNAQGVQDL